MIRIRLQDILIAIENVELWNIMSKTFEKMVYEFGEKVNINAIEIRQHELSPYLRSRIRLQKRWNSNIEIETLSLNN